MAHLATGGFPDTGLATLPDLDVEISLAPPTQGPIWRSVVSDARMAQGFSTKRGRSRELDRFQTGSLDLELNNRDREYDPEYTSSPIYEYIKPETRVRVLASYGGTQYVVFDGFVDGFEQKYPGQDADATVSISAGDGFKVLAQCDLPDDTPWDSEVLVDRPLVWHKLAETPSVLGTMYDHSGNSHTGLYGGGSSIAGLIAQSSDTAVDFDGTDDYAAVAADLGSPDVAAPLSIEFWFQTTQAPAATKAALLFFTDGAGKAVELDTGGKLSNVAGETTDAAVNDGAIHHAVFTYTSPTVRAIYLDGVLQSGGAGLNISVLPFNNGNWLGYGPTGQPAALVPYDGIIDEFCIYNYVLSATRILAHYNAGKAGASGAWGGDATGTRLGRLLDFVAWPAGDRDIDTGSSTVAPTGGFGGSSALDAIQTLSDTEQGQCYMGLDGAMSSDSTFKVVWRQRHATLTASRSITSNATFGDSGSELKYADILIDYGENRLYNAAEVTRSGGTTQRASDTEAQRNYLKRTYTKSGLLYASDNDSADHAHWAVDRYSDPEFRIIGLVIKPQRDGANLWPQVLGREIGDRITVKRRPQGVGDAIERDCIIEGVEHTMSDGFWTTIWRLSTVDARNYWILGTSELDTETRLAF